MTSQDDREKLMQRDVLLVAIAACSLLSGMHFSPWFDPIFFLLRPFIVGFTFGSPLVTLYVTSLFISILAVVLAGVPAAIYERAFGGRSTSATSLLIWLAGTLLLAIPAIMGWGAAHG